jgi:hypothetical protein
MRWRLALICLLSLGSPAHDAGAQISQDLAVLANQRTPAAERRAAWDRLAQSGPETLIPLLTSMRDADTTTSNWLRTAYDRVVERQQMQRAPLPVADLLKFARDARQPGRARRLALETVEEAQPGTAARLYPDWLDDPEFRFDAVGVTLTEARDLLKRGDRSGAEPVLRKALAAARDVQQARAAAAGLEQLGVKVSVGAHLGFLMDWYLLGPFDGGGQKGYHLSYPPEQRIDLGAEVAGQGGKKLHWVRYRAQEPAHNSGARHQALVNLREKDALGDADDAVAFAFTEFTVAKGGMVEFRGAADDNFTVWINGAKRFGFEEWRNGVRHDRHRFTAQLKEGKNTVLVKICQTPAPNPEPNWEFFLRVVDASGKGIALTSALR